ncbi:MAG: Tfp pilus assembly protein FimT/FimU [Oligosphaeraceae bacterium]
MTNRPFTLVELLTVTIIMTVIVGATVPAYNRIMTGNAVSYGNRMITSQLNMARTWACQKRRAVAVLFPDTTLASYYSEDLADPVALRTFRCAYVKKNGADWEFQEWVEGTQWQYLPKGAFFPVTAAAQAEVQDATYGLLPSAEVKGVYDGIEDPDVTPQTEQDKKELLFAGKRDFPLAIIFQPNGRPVVDARSPRVQVREGVVVENSGDAMVHKANVDNGLYARVNRYTGAVVTRELN